MKLGKKHKFLVTLSFVLVALGLNYQNCGNADLNSSDPSMQSEENSSFQNLEYKPCDSRNTKGCYPVKVKVTGMQGGRLTLQNGGLDDLYINRDGEYTFSLKLMAGSQYQIEAIQQPDDQVCTIENGGGVVDAAKSGASLTSINCVTMLKGCKGSQKSWWMPNNSSQSLGMAYLNSSNWSAQPELGMSENKTAVVYYRANYLQHRRHEINMTTNTVSSLFETPTGPWYSVDENDTGDIIAAWTVLGSSSVYYSEKISNVWSPVQSITIPSVYAAEPNVAINYNGDAIITWRSVSSSQGCYRAHKQSGIWNIPTTISDKINVTSYGCNHPKVAMSRGNNSNKAMIVWDEYNGSSTKVFASSFDGSAWQNPASTTDYLDPTFAGSMTAPEVAISRNGQRIAVAWQSGSSAHYVASKNFGIWNFPSTAMGSFNSYYAGAPNVKVNNSGNTIVTWVTSSAGMWMNEKINGVWGVGGIISPSGTSVNWAEQKSQDIDLNNFGKAIITWSGQYNGGRKFYKSERLNSTAPWVHPASAWSVFGDVTPGAGVGFSRVEVDEKCNAIMAWNNNNYIYRAEYE